MRFSTFLLLFGGFLPVFSFSQTVNVSTAAQLQTALNNAVAGQTIALAAGLYVRSGGFSAPAGRHGTSVSRIVLTGPPTAVLSSGTTTTGYGLGLEGNDFWTLEGFTIRNSKKGLVLDQSNWALISGLRIAQIGEEGLHLRTFSSFCTVQNCQFDSTGLVTPGFGEAIYVGSAVSNWCTYSACGPDACDHNSIVANAFGPRVAAENIDLKEGTCCGTVAQNAFDGAGLSGQNAADSWIDAKGNSYQIAQNTGQNTLLDGFQTHIAATGWGNLNRFEANVLTVAAAGYGIRVQTSNANGTAPSNVVCDDNSATGAALGLANVALVNCAVLPIDWLFFRATSRSGEGVFLEWATAAQAATERFEIERSPDGLAPRFEKIGERAAAQNSDAPLFDAFLDQKPLDGPNFYRLREIDRDGSAHFSPLATAFWKAEKAGFGLFPNPTDGAFFLKNERREAASFEKIEIRNGLCQTVRTFSDGENPTLEGLTSGLFWAFVRFEKGRPSGVFSIQKI